MYSYGLAWPIRHIAPYCHYLKYIWYHWESYCTKEEEIMERVSDTFEALSVRLEESDSFYKSGYENLSSITPPY